jgi:hypothetical protein
MLASVVEGLAQLTPPSLPLCCAVEQHFVREHDGRQQSASRVTVALKSITFSYAGSTAQRFAGLCDFETRAHDTLTDLHILQKNNQKTHYVRNVDMKFTRIVAPARL